MFKNKITWVDPVNRDAQFLNLIAKIIQSEIRIELEIYSTLRTNIELSQGIKYKPFFRWITEIQTGKISVLKRIIILISYLFSYAEISKCLRNGSTILYSSGMTLPEVERIGISILKNKSNKVFFLVHNLENSQSKWRNFSRQRSKKLLLMCDGLIFLSEYVRDQAVEFLGVPKNRTHVMLHPHFQNFLADFNSDQLVLDEIRQFSCDRLIFSFISRADLKHGVDLFYALIAGLAQMGLPVCGVIVGRYGNDWSYEHHTNSMSLHQLDNELIYARFGSYTYPELLSILSETDCVVAPYRRISQSGAISLALGQNLPVLASRVGANSEMVKHNYNGILFDINDMSSLVKEIEYSIQIHGSIRKRFTINPNFNSHLEPISAVTGMLEWISCLD